MPLIDVTIKPGFELKSSGKRVLDSEGTQSYIRQVVGPMLPALFAQNCEEFHMKKGTPEEAVQVRFHYYGPDDINVADVWVMVQFSEPYENEMTMLMIRDNVYNALVAAFVDVGDFPDDFVLDVFWGPSHGCGTVNGTNFKW